jgi:hypothetical protein
VVHRQVTQQPLSVGDLIAAIRGDRGDQRVRCLRGSRRGVDELLLERRPLGVVRGAPLGAERPDVQLRDAAPTSAASRSYSGPNRSFKARRRRSRMPTAAASSTTTITITMMATAMVTSRTTA